MRVYLNGGPAHSREVNIGPNRTTYLVAIPKPIDVFDPVPMPDYIAKAMPNYDVARYVFRGTGFVSIDGVCSALIFDYQGTING